MNTQELGYLVSTLGEILSNDNTVRKAAEDKLNAIKSGEPDKYACYLVTILQSGKIMHKQHVLMEAWVSYVIPCHS